MTIVFAINKHSVQMNNETLEKYLSILIYFVLLVHFLLRMIFSTHHVLYAFLQKPVLNPSFRGDGVYRKSSEALFEMVTFQLND